MAASLSIDLKKLRKDLEEVTKKIKETGQVTESTSLLNAIGQTVVTNTKDRMEKEITPEGTAWKRLKKPSKKRGGSSAKILRDTGRLYQSITYGIFSKELRVGSAVKYAKYHQKGIGKIPKRKFIGVSRNDIEDIDALIKIHLERLFK